MDDDLGCRRGRRGLRWVAVRSAGVALLPLVLAGCLGGEGGGGGSAGTATAPTSPGDAALHDAMAGLCDAIRESSQSVPKARSIFYDRSHEQLHELARRAQGADRAVTARLLEAKESVERDFLFPRTWPEAFDDLTRLEVTAREALGAAGVPEPPPCEGPA